MMLSTDLGVRCGCPGRWRPGHPRVFLVCPAGVGVPVLRREFGGVVIANDGFGEITTREKAQAILDEDLADAVAVGRLYLANPDLPTRWERGAELNEPNPDTFYGGGAQGYTDYPFLDAS